MDNVQNCDSYIDIPASQLTCWARSGDVMCFLWGTDKPTELSWILIKDRTMDNIQNCDSYINIPSSQTYRYYLHITHIIIPVYWSETCQLITAFTKIYNWALPRAYWNTQTSIPRMRFEPIIPVFWACEDNSCHCNRRQKTSVLY
jgi:hypothetical protein